MAARNPHAGQLDSTIALQIINTMYIVFLGVIFNAVFIVRVSDRIQVSLVFGDANRAIALFLLAYFIFSWLCWNALFRQEPFVTDYWVAISIIGIISLGATFMLTLSSDFTERKATFVAFLAYGLVSLIEDGWLLQRSVAAARKDQEGPPVFLYSRLISSTLKLFCLLFMAWGFLFLLSEKQEWVAFCLDKMRIAALGFAVVKLADYLMITRWPAARGAIAFSYPSATPTEQGRQREDQS